MSDAVAFRSSRTLPVLLAILSGLMLFMAVDAFRRGGMLTGLLGVAAAVGVAVWAWRAPRVEVDEAGVRERTPGRVRELRWEEITRVSGERSGGKGMMRLHRGEESWTLNFLAFPRPEQVVGFVTSHLPRTPKPAAPAEPEPGA